MRPRTRQLRSHEPIFRLRAALSRRTLPSEHILRRLAMRALLYARTLPRSELARLRKQHAAQPAARVLQSPPITKPQPQPARSNASSAAPTPDLSPRPPRPHKAAHTSPPPGRPRPADPQTIIQREAVRALRAHARQQRPFEADVILNE